MLWCQIPANNIYGAYMNETEVAKVALFEGKKIRKMEL